jgi:hypothetical protein
VATGRRGCTLDLGGRAPLAPMTVRSIPRPFRDRRAVLAFGLVSALAAVLSACDLGVTFDLGQASQGNVLRVPTCCAGPVYLAVAADDCPFIQCSEPTAYALCQGGGFTYCSCDAPPSGWTPLDPSVAACAEGGAIDGAFEPDGGFEGAVFEGGPEAGFDVGVGEAAVESGALDSGGEGG